MKDKYIRKACEICYKLIVSDKLGIYDHYRLFAEREAFMKAIRGRSYKTPHLDYFKRKLVGKEQTND